MVNKKTKKTNRRKPRERDEFEQRIIDLARVTRVMAGGKRLRFRACVVVGDHKGRLGYGLAKGADVAIAVNKAVDKAKKRLLTVRDIDGTIPHEINAKYKAAHIRLWPAPIGTGIVAGGAIRSVLELSGLKNIVAKRFGSNNKVNNVKATFLALESILDKKRDKKESKEKDNKNKDKNSKQDDNKAAKKDK